MDHPLLLSLVFGLGVFAQVLFSIYGKLDSKKIKELLFILLICLLTFFPNRLDRGDYYLDQHIFLYFFFFSLLFAAFFKKIILPRISELTLLSLNLTFWYLFLSYVNPSGSFADELMFLFFIPSTAVIVISFIDWKLPKLLKVFLYVWFLVIIIFFILSQFSFGDLSFFFNPGKITNLSLIDVFLTGMVSSYLLINLTYLMDLVPHRGHSLEDCVEHANFLASKFSNYQLKRLHALLIILVQGGALFMNFFFRFIPDFLLINILILTVPQALSYLFSEKGS